MFEAFSSGYYLGELYVEPHEVDRAAIHRDDHEEVTRQLYATGEGLERLDTPLVMKLEGRHFPVLGDEGVPTGTLAVPRDLADDDAPGRRRVLLAKADRAGELLRWSGWEPADAT